MSKQVLDNIIDKLRNEDTRWEALLDLKVSHDKMWLPHLHHYLADENWIVRWSVAEKLGDIGDKASVPNLLKVLKDPDFHVQKNAYKSLEKLGGDIMPYASAYLQDHDKKIREQVVALLVNCGDSVTASIKKHIPTQGWVVGTRLTDVLWQIEGEFIEDDLIDLVHVDAVQKHIIVLMGQVKSIKSIPYLVALYKKPSLKRLILMSCNNMNSKESFPQIIQALQTESLQKEARDMIVKVGKPMLQFLIAELAKGKTDADLLVEILETIGIEPIKEKIKSLSEKYASLRRLV